MLVLPAFLDMYLTYQQSLAMCILGQTTMNKPRPFAKSEQNHKDEPRKLTKMTRQQKISNTLLYLVLVPAVAAHHLALANFSLEEKSVQVPHYFLVGSFAFRGCIDRIRGRRIRRESGDCWLFIGNGSEAELDIRSGESWATHRHLCEFQEQAKGDYDRYMIIK